MGSTVTVGCKLPNGIIIKTGGKSVTLNGANSSRIIGGYGLTPVDRDFWEAWSREFSDFAPLRNHLIFVQDTASKAEGQAKEQAEVKSGLERLNRDKPAKDVKAEAYEGKPKES